jgi:hypothetical protein
MPTLILLDNSLSMYQLVNSKKPAVASAEKLTKRDLSFSIIRKLAQKLSTNYPYEKLALVGSFLSYIVKKKIEKN